MAVPIATIGLAVVVAAVTAVALSSRFPSGPFTVLEPDSGIDTDLLVLLLGLGLVALMPLAAVLVAVNRQAANLLAPVGADDRSSGFARQVARSGAPEPLVAAVRLTVDSGRGASYVPTRSVLVSTVVVVVVLTGGVVFAENLRALDRNPDRYGWRGEALAWADGGYGGFDPETSDTWLEGRDDIDGWRYVAGDRTVVDGRATPGLAYGPGSGDAADYEPVLTEGHAPTGPDEVVLGEETLASIDADVGDTVTLGIGEAAVRATVVGTAVFPVFGPALAVRTGLDEGAWVAPDAGVFDFVGTFGPAFNGLLLDLAPGADVAALDDAADGSELVVDGTDVDIFGVIEPTEVATTTDATRYQPALLGALAVTGLLSILLTLVTVVRRRRPDLSTYRVLGFTPGQLRATIAVQGLLFAVAAVVIGAPIGVALGRELWRRFADALGAVETTDVPWALVAAACGVVLLVGVVSAVPPAIAAGRGRLRPRDERA